MVLQYIILTCAAIFAILGYRNYFKKISSNEIQPNRWSWLIWSFATILETITYDAVSEDPIKSIIFYIASVSCVIITIKIWNKSARKKPDDASEIFSVVMCLVAVIIWVSFNSAWWAHLVLLVSLPIAFIPTYKDAWKNYKSENCAAWWLWSIGDLFALLLILLRFDKAQEVPYAVIEFVCHALVVAIVVMRMRMKMKMVRVRTQ